MVCLEAYSQAGGYYNHGNKDVNLFNGPIYVLAKIIKNVMSSAAKSEVADLLMNMNVHHAVSIRLTLEYMYHKQTPTLLHTDNKTA